MDRAAVVGVGECTTDGDEGDDEVDDGDVPGGLLAAGPPASAHDATPATRAAAASRDRQAARMRGIISRAYRSRRDTTPSAKALSTSLARFWFCGRSSMWNLWNSVRRWVFTASTLRNSSEATSWFEAGVA